MVLQTFWENKLVHSLFNSLISQSKAYKKINERLVRIYLKRTVYTDVHQVVGQDFLRQSLALTRTKPIQVVLAENFC